VQGRPGVRNIGQPEAALRSYQKELEIAQHLNRLKPGNDAYTLQLANCYAHFGEIYQSMEKYPEALENYRKANDIAGTLPLASRSEPDVLLRLIDIGDMQLAMHDTASAAATYQQALVALEQGGYVKGAANCHESMAELNDQLGDRLGADQHRRAALEIWRKVAAAHAAGPVRDSDARDPGYEVKIGMLLEKLGENQQALDAYRLLLERRQRLAHEHPAHVGYQSDLWKIQGCIGQVLLKLGRNGEARQAQSIALELASTLSRADPHDATARSQHLISLSDMAKVEMALAGEDARSPVEVLALWQSAKEHLSQFERIAKSQAMLAPTLRDETSQLPQQMRQCDAAIARLQATHP
jgi:tetratricopeptide (TPR) repeat protein